MQIKGWEGQRVPHLEKISLFMPSFWLYFYIIFARYRGKKNRQKKNCIAKIGKKERKNENH